ncbi:Mitosis inhibitor protein kinase wee1 [Nosema bombycis CQ1]|uniref:Mitosis inhibitor protein kinase wee1 n=1 Tax=Nosema bombycis (strain CQ1 / CVCC 102059) TaxID=578461 RepID=R0MB31_NOSB1|nr:Mitosis inhibitor protein kinase wee1 [Nosema bombycis CQ1]|eukprot:EOB11245.1 Mitosis inhibitor protein kinase wee1 [Nosema bombycis CQ1]
MTDKKPFTFKYEKSDSLFPTPKTPVKRVPFKDIFSPPPSLEVPPTFHRLISKGDFFEVYLNKNKNEEDNAEYTAVKKSIFTFKNDLEKESILREVHFLKLINSDFVIKFINNWILNQYVYIEVEYCSYGTLREFMNYIYFTLKSKFSKEIKNKIIKEIGLGLEAIHKLKIVHLDLKPENIFLKSNNNNECGGEDNPSCYEEDNKEYGGDPSSFTIKIGDFNISRFENEEIGMDGDKRYMAPEVLNGICTRKSDIFSFGLIYLEILNEIILPTGGEKWVDLRKGNLKGMVLEGPIKKMLNKDYKKRIDCETMLKEIL